MLIKISSLKHLLDDIDRLKDTVKITEYAKVIDEVRDHNNRLFDNPKEKKITHQMEKIRKSKEKLDRYGSYDKLFIVISANNPNDSLAKHLKACSEYIAHLESLVVILGAVLHI
jgi:hypothetical protein